MISMPIYSHKNVYITTIEEDHLSTLRCHRNDYSTWVNLSDVCSINEDQQLSWYKNLVFDSTRKYFMLWLGRVPIGLIRIDEIDYINRSARVGCDIFSAFREKGFGTEAMELTISYCFDVLNMHRLHLSVAAYNKAAKRIYTKVGFTEEGIQKDALYRFGKYNDYIMMSLIKGEENE